MYMPALFNDSLFDDFFTDITDNKRRPVARPLPGVMKTDIKEKDNSYELEVDIPGYKKEDIKMHMEDGY